MGFQLRDYKSAPKKVAEYNTNIIHRAIMVERVEMQTTTQWSLVERARGWH